MRLIEIAKSGQDPVLVAGPALLRLVAFKLNAIGFMGGFVLGFKPGERRVHILQTLAAMLEAPKNEKITTAALAAVMTTARSDCCLRNHPDRDTVPSPRS